MRHFSFYIALWAVFFMSLTVSSRAQQPGQDVQDSVVDSVAALDIDSTLKVSLLTCSPGSETYELYGHTALRVTSLRDSLDIVYNYGVFDFYTPHFVWRFLLGQCDYLLVGESLPQFLTMYYYRGSSVLEQELNLTPEEATRLSESLREESQLKNRVYRYNIFFNNCTTRARDKIEAHIRGDIIYPVRPRRNTFRTILHQFTQNSPWSGEGNDLLLGQEVDTFLSERSEMFSPIYFMWYADSAIIDAGHNRYRNLVRERRWLLLENPARQQVVAAKQPSFPLTPRMLGWLLLALGLGLASFEWRRKRVCWPVELVLMTCQGVAGLLLSFMTLFSEHPGVASNWQVWVLNPVPLLFLYSVIRSDIRGQRHVYHAFVAVAMLAFVILYFIIPQDFSELILPLALLLLSRAVVHLLVYRNS